MLGIDDMLAFCDLERRAEKAKWDKTLTTSVEELLDNGDGVEARVEEDGKRLVPLSAGHRFKDTDRIYILPGDTDRRKQYTEVVRLRDDPTALRGITPTGDLLCSGIPLRGTVLAMPSTPLLDVYTWQQSIVLHWLRTPNPDAHATALLELLGKPSTAEQSERVEACDPWKPIYPEIKKYNSGPILVQGPPGCGKTTMSAELVRLALKDGLSIGIFAFTNRACNEVLRRILDPRAPQLPRGCIRRLGPPESWEDVARLGGVKTAKLLPERGTVLGSTLYKLTKEVNKAVQNDVPVPRFDLALVDEASQMTLPMLTAPLACANRVVLVGDQRQLPPIVHSSVNSGAHPELVEHSAFEYLAQRKQFFFLPQSRRMVPAVCKLPSQAFYGGNLRSDVPTLEPWPATPHVTGVRNRLLCEEPGLQLVLVERDPVQNESKTSMAEARLIAQITHDWEEHHLKFLKSVEDSFQDQTGLRYLVSCFYRKQVSLVRDVWQPIAKLLPGRVHTDSVERNQGQTSTIAFLSIGDDSFAASNHGQAWLLDPRRLNVAITRARIKSYVLACPEFVKMACSAKNQSAESRTAWQMLSDTAIKLV